VQRVTHWLLLSIDERGKSVPGLKKEGGKDRKEQDKGPEGTGDDCDNLNKGKIKGGGVYYQNVGKTNLKNSNGIERGGKKKF